MHFYTCEASVLVRTFFSSNLYRKYWCQFRTPLQLFHSMGFDDSNRNKLTVMHFYSGEACVLARTFSFFRPRSQILVPLLGHLYRFFIAYALKFE